MAYIGRQLSSGNYLKLDDISSQFNGSTRTFNLTAGGQAFYPGSPYALFLSLGGVVQEPNSAFELNINQITFAVAPTAGTKFFCVALSQILGIGVPADATVSGPKLTQPFNYNSGLLYLDSVNNRIGISTTTPTSKLHVSGNTLVSGIITATGTIVSNNGINAETVPFFRNTPTIASDYTVTTTYNELSIGPITINNGITVTVNSGATWTVV